MKINKIRAFELEIGDSFSIFNMDYWVKEIKDGQIVYMKYCFTERGNLHPNGHLLTMGCKSQQFVNLLRHADNRRVKKQIPTDPEIVGPGLDRE